MFKLKRLAVISTAVMLTIFGYGKAFSLTMTGSTTVFPLAQYCAEVFSDQNPKMKVAVRGGGSSVGIAALSDRTTDIGMSSRPMSAKEIKTAKMKGVNPTENIVAWDGIAVIVNQSTEMDKITISQLKDIFSGKITNWGELGLKRQKIVVVSRDTSSGTFEAFNVFVMKGEKVASTALMQASNEAIASIVSSTPGAIGYIGMGYIRESIKVLSINGQMPTKATVKNKTYPFSRPLYMYTNGAPKGDVASFINFVLGSQGQKIVEEEGFVAVK